MRSLKALSPIVAVVMLILIAIAASVLVYVWMSGLVASTPTTEPTLQERIKIDAVKYDANTDTATIYVRNIGEITTNTSSAYIIDTETDSVVCANVTTNIANVDLKPGEVEEVLVKNCILDTGKTYIAKVSTYRGTEATYTFIIEQ